MKILKKIWKNRNLPTQLSPLSLGWNHGLIKIAGEIRHGAFVNIYHLYPGGNYSLKPLWAFSNKTIYLQLQWLEVCSSLERLQELLKDQTIVAFPPENSQVVEFSRVVYQVVQIDSRVSSNDLILEIEDIYRLLNHEADSLDLCRLAISKYCDDPTEENLVRLRKSYLSIPANRRPFLISMDAKDHLVRQIIGTEDKNQLESLTNQLRQEIDYSWKNIS